MTPDATPHLSLPAVPACESSDSLTGPQPASATPSAAVSVEVAAQIASYWPKTLTGDAATTLVPEIRAAAVACMPPTKAEALALMSNVSRFCAGVLDAYPDLPCSLDELLSEARIVWWSNRCLQAGESRKTIAVQIPRLRRMRRVLDGLPARMRAAAPRTRLAEVPLTDVELRRLAGAVPDEMVRAALGAAVCAGLVGGAAVGGAMTRTDSGVVFVTADGAHELVPDGLEWLAVPVLDVPVESHGWDALMRAADECGIVFNRVVAAQTRWARVFTSGEPTAQSIRAFTAGRRGIERIVAHLPAVSKARRDSMLRGEPDAQGDCTPRVGAHAAGQPGLSGGRRESTMAPAVNRSEVKRLAAAARARQDATPSLDPALEALLVAYEPDPKLVRGHWDDVRAVHHEVMRRSRITGPESFKRHCWIVAGYLGWRAEEGLGFGIADAMDFSAIDQYYLRGLTGCSERTRNTYRSKLRLLAGKVNPSLAAPPAATPLGHQEVRAPYTSLEVAQIQRVALRQRNSKTRQQLCMGIALHGGVGAAPTEVRAMAVSQIKASGDATPIWVDIEGSRPRRVPVRHDFEELMHVGLEGTKPNDLVLGKEAGRRNVLCGIVERAENYDAPHIEARRLRSTWIATLMQERIPVNVIMDAAGLVSARTLTELAGMLDVAVDLAELRGEDQ